MLIQDKLKLHWNILPKGWRFFIVTVLIIGIFFRFFNLEKKLFWVDETDSLLRISGHTRSEVLQQVYDGQIINVEELQKNYQQISSEKNFISTFKSLTKDVHPPLYFMMGRFWMLLLGDSVTSVTAIRSFSAFLSILVFPCLYWLCTELFGSQVIGWTAVIVVAVSPFHVLYAQEARMYSLWTVLILLSSAALLRAIR
jgi:uncharacterized membrane protein